MGARSDGGRGFGDCGGDGESCCCSRSRWQLPSKSRRALSAANSASSATAAQ